MAIQRVLGPMLGADVSEDLARDEDLSFGTDILFVDYTNGRIGVKTTGPTVPLEVVGGTLLDNISIATNTISSNNTDGNIIITPDGTGTIELNKDINVNAADLTLANAPTLDLHAATKQYVDGVAAGLDFKATAHMCTVSNLAATYNNGTQR
jgi:hypothetical protein